MLEPKTAPRDSHDLGESLQHVLESVPGAECAWVHLAYWAGNLPSHLDRAGEGA